MIPLYQRPATVVFVDDEPTYIEMLGMVLPASWHVELFTRAQECLNFMQQDAARAERDLLIQQRIVQKWQQGDGTLVQALLDYWTSDAERYDTTRVLVVDYSMPSMSGLELLDQLGDWGGTRILLTGRADEHTAVAAFNRGQIDQYVPKQTADITQRVLELVGRALLRAHPGRDQVWRGSLDERQLASLRHPTVVESLAELVSKQWVEYCLIGQPFGILGADTQGNVSWLQLELRDNLNEHAELLEAALGSNASPEACAQVRGGFRLANLEFQLSLRRDVTPQLESAFDLGDGRLIAAYFPVDLSVPAYSAWRAEQNRRAARTF